MMVTGIFRIWVCLVRDAMGECQGCEITEIFCAWLAGYSREFHYFQKLVIPVYITKKQV